jgi:hypothetical protein
MGSWRAPDKWQLKNDLFDEAVPVVDAVYTAPDALLLERVTDQEELAAESR